MPLGLLEGIRVLDLGPEIAAPFCSRLLADYGADVVKVEPPNVGDPARHMGPYAGDEPHLEKCIPFLYLNTNKRGITLDIGTAAGREVLSDLVGSVDVVVQGFPPSESEALGLDFKTLGESNPGVVVTSITPFGLSGPYRNYSATDIVTCAISGLMYHSGDSDREPLRNALSQSLYVAGANAAVATVAALFHRMATGQGQQVDVSCGGVPGNPSGASRAVLRLHGSGQRPPPGPRIGIRGAYARPRRLRGAFDSRLPTLAGGGGAYRCGGIARREVRLRGGKA